jgi:hypothetical protein
MKIKDLQVSIVKRDDSGLFWPFFRSVYLVSGIILTNLVKTSAIPTREVDDNAFWRWRQVSEIVAAINKTGSFFALQLGDDAPSVQIAWQSNVKQIKNVPVTGSAFIFPQSVVEPDSVIFNVAVPGHILSEGNASILGCPARNGRQLYGEVCAVPGDRLPGDPSQPDGSQAAGIAATANGLAALRPAKARSHIARSGTFPKPQHAYYSLP